MAKTALEAGESGNSLAWLSAVDELLKLLDSRDVWTNHVVTCHSEGDTKWKVDCPHPFLHSAAFCPLEGWLNEKLPPRRPIMGRAVLDYVDFDNSTVRLVIY